MGQEVVDLAFTGSVSKISGLTFDEVRKHHIDFFFYYHNDQINIASNKMLIYLQLARETLSFWVKAFSEDTTKRLENFGFIQFRPGGNMLNGYKCFLLAVCYIHFHSI